VGTGIDQGAADILSITIDEVVAGTIGLISHRDADTVALSCRMGKPECPALIVKARGEVVGGTAIDNQDICHTGETREVKAISISKSWSLHQLNS
jgi:hypothetical protein